MPTHAGHFREAGPENSHMYRPKILTSLALPYRFCQSLPLFRARLRSSSCASARDRILPCEDGIHISCLLAATIHVACLEDVRSTQYSRSLSPVRHLHADDGLHQYEPTDPQTQASLDLHDLHRVCSAEVPAGPSPITHQSCEARSRQT